MDGGGRFDQSLTRSGQSGVDPIGASVDEPFLARAGSPIGRFAWFAAARRSVHRWSGRIARLPLPQGLGILGAISIIGGALAYGTVEGQHLPSVVAWLQDTRNIVANAAGFRIAAITVAGQKEIGRDEILSLAGVTGRASLLFLDADAARTRLMANPWIADAAVLKLYPDRLQITITERQAFALWQMDGRVNVIAADGTVLETFADSRYVDLPLVVGPGAQQQAKDFIAVIDRYPDIRSVLRASILVAERRWNLRLNNGIDVRLPETDVEAALDRLVTLDRDKKLLTRDITVVDLRLPDRVTVRLSDAAAQARDEALQGKKKKKAGDA
jgi:cell division protein FtsQ